MKNGLLIINLLVLLLTACDPDDGDVFVYNNYFSIHQINSDGSNSKQLVERGYLGFPRAIYFVDNDSKILIVYNDQIIEVDLVSLNRSSFSIGGGGVRSSALSHDRKKIAIIKEGSASYDLYIFDIISKTFSKITNTPALFKRDLSFSNDDSKIVYTISHTNYAAIESITIATGVINEIARNTSLYYTSLPFYSPVFGLNNTEVFYLSHEEGVGWFFRSTYNYVVDTLADFSCGLTFSGPNEFLIYQLNTYPLQVVSHSVMQNKRYDLAIIPYVGGIVSTSNDGMIVVIGYKGGDSNEDITFVNIDGANSRSLCKGQLPALSSDGSKIAFVYMEMIRQ